MREAARSLVALALLVGASGAARAADGDALVTAIRANDAAAVRVALADHADPNERLAFGASPLGWAVEAQNAEMVALLLARGADPNAADGDGVTPLALACELGDGGVVDRLLDAHADVRKAEPDGAAPLAICARYGPAGAVARMLGLGATADSIDARGQTPLMWAASAGRREAVAALIGAGADVNCVSKGGFTPLFFAIKGGSVPVTELLLAAGARADYRGPENASAAQLAVYQKHFDVAALFVARGADLAERDRTGETLLHAAAAGGDAALVGLLLTKGADPNALTGPSRITWVTEANFGIAPPPVPPTPPLLLAAAKGHVAVMRQLLAAGANPRFVAADGTNIVIAATEGGSAPALALALDLAPDANVARKDGATPLHLLAEGTALPDVAPMLRLLAAHGARTDLKEKHGLTAAYLADNGRTEVKAAFFAAFPSAAKTRLADAGAKPLGVPGVVKN